MSTAKKQASSKEKALASKMVRLMAKKGKDCVPMTCKIVITSCRVLAKCDPMACDGLKCDSLKKV